jgi:hypothetical protein
MAYKLKSVQVLLLLEHPEKQGFSGCSLQEV